MWKSCIEMKKIALFTYSIYSLGGEQRVVSLLANELSKNHDVTIFTMDADDKNDNLFGLSDKISVRRYHPYNHDAVSYAYRAATHLVPWLVYDIFPKMLERAYCANEYARLMNELITDDYDTVIVTAWQLSIILGKVKEKYNRSFKAIAWEHNSYEAYFETKYKNLYKSKSLFIEYIKNIDEIVVLAEDYKRKYQDNLGISSTVIYNAKTFSVVTKSDVLEKTMFACSRIETSQKGIDLLLSSFKRFCESNVEWKLCIAGIGSGLEECKKMVHSMGLDERVEFLGQINNVAEWLQKSSIFVLSSRWEGFPMSVTEAFEVGVPVVAFDIPAMIPFVNSGGAIAAKCYDVDEYASLLLQLANDIDTRREMGQKAIEFAKSLSMDDIVKQWEEIL